MDRLTPEVLGPPCGQSAFTRARACILLVALACLALINRASAQYAPEGNAHPETRMVSGDRVANPFGDPTRGDADAKKKSEFAASVDVAPLRDLAVFHNGRIKILDTLARETVRKIVGKKQYEDFIHAPGTPGADAGTYSQPAMLGAKDTVRRVKYDPAFTLLDLMIDPGYYFDKPLMAVNYLPLRRAFLEASFAGDTEKVERWMRLGRVTPAMVQEHARAIIDAHADEPGYREALNALDLSISLWQQSTANLDVVAPERGDLPWRHLSTLSDDHPARRAAAELGAAWRAADAAKVNAAVRTLASELPKINASVYPTARRDLEATYNRVNAFEWGFWAYCFAFVALLLAFGTGRKALVAIGVATLALAIGLHAFGFITRCIIAERFAIQNQFESMTGISLFAAVVGGAIMLLKRQWLFGAAAAGVGFMVLVTATQTAIPGQSIEREAAILNTSVLLKYHVTTVLVSYGLISLGFLVSLFYLGVHYFGRRDASAQLASAGGLGALSGVALGQEDGTPVGRERTLKDLDVAQMTVLQLAFWTLGVGILLGAWWADHSWGRWWAFDPKETWALLTWIVYLIVIHVRLAAKRRELVTAWLSVVGFFVMLWTYFGVNLILPGLHAYA